MQSNLKMQDYYKGMFCNADDPLAFAIEPEISRNFYENNIENYYSNYIEESDCIFELTSVHHGNRATRCHLYDDISQNYKGQFPIGSDGYVSGGIHFVLFGEFSSFHRSQTLKWKLLNCPLFLKIHNGEVYGREMNTWCQFSDSIRYGSKGQAITLKDNLYTNSEEVEGTPIEFRCNNVFDDRVLGYYQGVLLAEELGIKFKKTSDGLRTYAKNGDSNCYNGEGGNDKDVTELEGYTLTRDDLVVMRYNIKKILQILRENNLTVSANRLKEYCNENGIMYI